MRKLVFVVTILFVLLAASVTVAQEAAPKADLTLVIYNQGTSLVRERRTLELQRGLNWLTLDDVAALDPTSVRFRSLTRPDTTWILEQNYFYDLIAYDNLLKRYIGETIIIVTTDNVTHTGRLLEANGTFGSLTIQKADGKIIYASGVRTIEFPALPGGLVLQPTLRWRVRSAEAGPQEFELTYLTTNLNWTADYTMLLSPDKQHLDLNGWVTVTNNSGASFTDAQVKLVAGNVRHVMVLTDAGTAEGSSSNVALLTEERNLFEYKLYELVEPVTVANHETKQVQFVQADDVPGTIYYVFDTLSTLPANYHTGFLGQGNRRDVQVWLALSTGPDGANVNLAAGRVRMYQEDADGLPVLIGENTIENTPQGEMVHFPVGIAFDLVGERQQINFESGSGFSLEAYEIKLRNRKADEAVEIRVPEWFNQNNYNWEIVDASDPYTQHHTRGVEFRVIVEPGQEKVITYTVRYTW